MKSENKSEYLGSLLLCSRCVDSNGAKMDLILLEICYTYQLNRTVSDVCQYSPLRNLFTLKNRFQKVSADSALKQ